MWSETQIPIHHWMGWVDHQVVVVEAVRGRRQTVVRWIPHCTI